MKRQSVVFLCVVLVFFAGVAMADFFTWTGSGPDDDWPTCANWQSIAPDPDPCYPAETNDDVSIDGNSDTVYLVDADEQIDDLTLRGIFTFHNGSAVDIPLLKVDTVLIVGGASGATITTRDGVKIQNLTIP